MKIKFDELLENHIGVLGKFQWLVILWLCMEEMFLTFQIMGPVFLAATPKQYWCQHPQLNNDTIFGNCSLDERLHMTVPPGSDVTENGGLSHCTRYDVEFPPGSCNHGNNSDAYIQDWDGGSSNATSGMNLTSMETECTEWTYDTSVFESTIVTEWELVCTTRRRAQAKVVASVFLAGRAVGNVLFGWMADRYGRRLVFLTAGVANVVVAVVAAFTPTYLPFVCLRFLQAILATGKTNASFVISVEMSGPSRRVFVASFYFGFWAIGFAVLSGIGFFVRDWRTLLVVISVPEMIIYIVYWFVGPESPRWLYMNGRAEEADRIVAKMAKVNKVELPKNLVIEQETKAEAGRPSDLFRTPQIRYVTLITTYVWAVCGITYYCLNLTPEIFGDNLFIVMPVLGAIECVASFSVTVLFEFGGRVPTFSGCMALGGACLLVSIPFSKV